MSAGVRARETLWSRLAAAGFVRGAMPAAAPDGGPWYIRAMIGAAAWIAALFLLAFVGIGVNELLRTSGAKVVAGALLCAASAGLLKRRDGAFVGQLGLALSLTGQALFAAGWLGAFRSHGMPGAAGAWIVAAFEVLLAIAIPSFVHRVFCTLGAALAASYALAAAGLGTLGLPLCAAAFAAAQLDDARLARFPRAWPAFGIGLALAVIALLPFQLGPDEWRWWGSRQPGPLLGPRVADAAMGAVFFGAALALVAKSGLERRGAAYRATLAGALALALIAVWVPGLAAALLVLLAGFATAQAPLTGLGVIALLAALARYYHTLAATLLDKSAALLATALVLFALWRALRRAGRSAAENGHA